MQTLMVAVVCVQGERLNSLTNLLSLFSPLDFLLVFSLVAAGNGVKKSCFPSWFVGFLCLPVSQTAMRGSRLRLRGVRVVPFQGEKGREASFLMPGVRGLVGVLPFSPIIAGRV